LYLYDCLSELKRLEYYGTDINRMVDSWVEYKTKTIIQ
jgi:hypothetical protein